MTENKDSMPDPSRPPTDTRPSPLSQGRDEMNLAEFPISVATRKQPKDKQGQKLDQITYQSTTYDPSTRRRIPQTVTLTTASRYGLPTPADENVLLSLLLVAKKTTDFREARVYFVPRQLFLLMRWSLNSRSYQRLSQVLRRLRAVQILFENAWWDAEGREYEREFSTGIIAEYELTRPKKGSGGDPKALSFVHWTPQFFKSLAGENIKKLDLELYFSLRLATSQRMYRFLDKRFYTSPIVELDLKDFACGHIGLTDPKNNGILKQRLAPAIAELEGIGFIAAAPPKERYKKVKKGIWRVHFERGSNRQNTNAQSPLESRETPSPASSPEVLTPEAQLVYEFYRLWSPDTPPSEQALGQARDLIAKPGYEQVQSWVPKVVKRMRVAFPDAKHFGASLSFFAALAQEHTEREQHQKQQQQAAQQKRAERDQEKQDQETARLFTARWQPVWESLTDAERQAIRSTVLETHPAFNSSQALRQSRHVTQLCLHELSRRSETPATDVADGPQTA